MILLARLDIKPNQLVISRPKPNEFTQTFKVTNYGNSPAPLLQALHIGQQTQRLKIATGILVLPIWQPLRLAEEVAVLDNLIDGRFICGVGRGYQPHEFARFGVTVPESHQRFSESLDVMIKAWTQDESFTYDGEYIKIPNEVTV